MEVIKSVVEKVRVEGRKRQARKILDDMLTTDIGGGIKLPSGAQNLWEVLDDVVDLGRIPVQGTRGGLTEEGVFENEELRMLTQDIQDRLPGEKKLKEHDINRLLGVDEEQKEAIIDAVAKSKLPLMRKTPSEIRRENLRKINRSR